MGKEEKDVMTGRNGRLDRGGGLSVACGIPGQLVCTAGGLEHALQPLLFAVLIVDSKTKKRRITMNSVLPDHLASSPCVAFVNHCTGRTVIFCDEEVTSKLTLAGGRGGAWHLFLGKLVVVGPAISIKSVVH